MLAVESLFMGVGNYGVGEEGGKGVTGCRYMVDE